MARDQCFSPANGDRPNVRNIAIMITDGLPYPPSRRQPAIDMARSLREKGVSVIAIGKIYSKVIYKQALPN